ncbi:hypothetical protein C8R46DRAFT_1070626 [Mycena filopes]|nr:hypothetical protein C8R46DRAFT_1070626 [Mycena filopes]
MADSECTHKCPNCSTVFRDSDLKALSIPLQPSVVPREIVDTNNIPHEAQVPSVRDFIVRGRAYVDILDAKRALLQASLDQLDQEMDELDKEIRKHEGSISLILSMPTEILSTIFAFTVSRVTTLESAPWTVSAVCARWRATVTSQPSFWTSIVLRPRRYPDLPNLWRVEQQLLRSGELPLDVEFSALYASSGISRSLFKLLPPLCANARRWEKLSIAGSSLLYSDVKRLVKEPMVLLQELELEVQFDDEDPEDTIVASVDIFHDAPLLQRVTVNKALWHSPLTMKLPWPQITRFGGSSTWAGHLGSLSSAANLVECTLEIQGTNNPPAAPILLPQLLRLALSHAAFLECLETPALLELYCDYASPLLPFLHRNRCRLHTLFVWQCAATAADSDMTGILDAVPTVTHLGLERPLTTEFVAQLCSSSSAQALECISLEYYGGGVSMDARGFELCDQFANGVESRWAGGRLKSVRLLANWFPPTLLRRMRLLQAEGMELEVFHDRERFYQAVVPPRLHISTEDW